MYYYLFKEGGKILGGRPGKLKGGGSMVLGSGLLKRGREAGTFPIQFFQGLSFLPLKITLLFAKLCYAFEEKKIFLPP